MPNPITKTTSAVSRQRVEQAIRLRYSPLPELSMDLLVAQLNSFRVGHLRPAARTWDIMLERDMDLACVASKRFSDAARQDWEIFTLEDSAEADAHRAALNYAYNHLVATSVLEQDERGGVSALIRYMLTAHAHRYSVQEIILRPDNPARKEVTAEFRHCPVWFFEARQGRLAFLPDEGAWDGVPLNDGEWLRTVGLGLMRPCSLGFLLKTFGVSDLTLFSKRFGIPGVHAETTAAKDSAEWTDAEAALAQYANDWVTLTNQGLKINLIEAKHGAASSLPMTALVEIANAGYAKLFRGGDLSTQSRGNDAIGASLQTEEKESFLHDDCQLVSETLNGGFDRPLIHYLFGTEPKAFFRLNPPKPMPVERDLKSAEFLLRGGVRIAKQAAAQRFGWPEADANETEVLGAPVSDPANARNGETAMANTQTTAPVALANASDANTAAPLDQTSDSPHPPSGHPLYIRWGEGQGEGPTEAPVALANACDAPLSLAISNEFELDDEGWALLLPRGRHPKERLISKDGATVRERFVQMVDDESLRLMLANSAALSAAQPTLAQRVRRFIASIPIFKGHPDLKQHAPETVTDDGAAVPVGLSDRLRATARGLETRVSLVPEGVAAVANEGCKYLSALVLVQPTGATAADGAVEVRPFKVLSIGLTPTPNIAGVDSLANAANAVDSAPPQDQAFGVPPLGGISSEPAEAGTPNGVIAVSPIRPFAGSETGAPAPDDRRQSPDPSSKATASISAPTHNPIDPMKQLLLGWLAAQGVVLANDSTDDAVFQKFREHSAAQATTVTLLGNDKATLTTNITALNAELGTRNAELETARAALSNVQTALANARQGRAEALVDLAIVQGRKSVAERDAEIARLVQAGDAFDAAATVLANAAVVHKTAPTAGGDRKPSGTPTTKQQARERILALANSDPRYKDLDMFKAMEAIKTDHPALFEELNQAER